MAYSKQTWTDNTTQVTAARLGHIEDGIAAAQTTADAAVTAPPTGAYPLDVFPYTDATVTRPTVAPYVRLLWVGPGPTQPTNMATIDLVLYTS